MAKTKDIAKNRYGRLLALGPDPEGARGKWLFQCDCGLRKSIKKHSVTRGYTKSCGCLHRDRCKSGLNRLRHGDARTGAVKRLHSIWRGMLKRCNPSNNIYATERYAARGVTVCADWRDYTAFRDWAINSGYADDLSIDRVDNALGYSPENCRWATKTEQARNRTTSRYLEVDGERRVVAEWCEVFGISSSVFYNRVKRGWDAKRALTTPARVVHRSVASRRADQRRST